MNLNLNLNSNFVSWTKINVNLEVGAAQPGPTIVRCSGTSSRGQHDGASVRRVKRGAAVGVGGDEALQSTEAHQREPID